MDFMKILYPIEWVVAWIMFLCHKLFTLLGLPDGSGAAWILSIVGLVIVIRTVMIPLFFKQIRASRGMQMIQPELQAIQKKYKNKKDPASREAMSRETMALYKKHGTTPMSSCLPLLVQMPIFFSLFSVLSDVSKHAKDSIGGVGLLNPELTQQFYDAKLFGVASLHETLGNAVDTGNTTAIIILVTLVVLMIGSQFFTQLQIISKNLSPEEIGRAHV